MAEVHCFTSATYGYLDRVRVLAGTLAEHHPEWKFWLCLPDDEPPGFSVDFEELGVHGVVRLGDLDIPDQDQWVFQHDVIELCTAVKGKMLVKLLAEGASKVIYLDPDTALFARLDDVVTLLDQHDVVLTPHQLQPDDDRMSIVDNEIGSLKYGIYNLGFFAVASTDEGRRFARWWQQRLHDFCIDDVPNGLFTDQRWCDHAPVFFPGLHVLRDPGFNVASWNLSRRPVVIDLDGTITAGGSRLRFFHFTKVTSVGERMIERYSGDRLDVLELLKWYRRTLTANAVTGLPAGWWAYGTYDDGTPIPLSHRRAYRTSALLRERFPHPYEAGADSLQTHLSGSGLPT